MAALVKHGITDKTAKQLLFRAGVYYKGFKVTGSTFDGTVLGATSGGGKITIEQEYLDAELDGAGVKLKGAKNKVGETATMEINFTEIRSDVIATGLHMKKDDEFSDVEGYEKYSSQDDITDADYEENVAFAGQLNSGKFAIVVFHNAFCTGSVELEPKNKEQLTYAQTYEGHATVDQDGLFHLPIDMYFPTEAGLLAKATPEQVEAELQEV